MRSIGFTALCITLAAFVAGCGQFGKVYTGEVARDNTDPQAQRITDKPFDAAARKAAGCGEFEDLESEGAGHTSDPKEKIKYRDNPPASGRHYEVALPWGVYEEQQPDSHWVHNLEHGHVVVLHKGLSDEQQQELLEQRNRAPYHFVIMPREENPKDGVYYMAWTKRLYCERPSAEAMQEFADRHMDNAPEVFMDDPQKRDDHA